jgi:peptide/nickel transport system ATP-binding protein
MSWPAGCRFATRCDYAMDRCRDEDPRLLQAGPAQRAACWLCEHGARAVRGAPV